MADRVVPQPAPFRTVALDGGASAVWQLELRALKVSLDRLPELRAILEEGTDDAISGRVHGGDAGVPRAP